MEVKPGGSGGPALNWLSPLKCSLSQSDPPSLPHEWQDRVLTNFETTYKQSTSTISWLFVSSFPSCPSLPPRASCPSLPPRASPSSLCGTGNALTLHNESKQVIAAIKAEGRVGTLQQTRRSFVSRTSPSARAGSATTNTTHPFRERLTCLRRAVPSSRCPTRWHRRT